MLVRRIKIMFEAGPMLDHKKTGVGYYVGHLMASLQANYPDKLSLNGYYFDFLSKNKKSAPANGMTFYKIWLMPGKILSFCRRLGFQPFLELFTHKQADLVLFTNYVALPQLRKQPIALIVYDLCFLDIPEYTQERNLKYLNRFCPPSIERADIIITISEFTKARLLHHFPNLKAAIVITPIPPINQSPPVGPLDERLTGMGIRKKAYVLYLGTIEPRKNLQALAQAYSKLSPELRAKYSLVLAGGKGWKDEKILDVVQSLKEKGVDIIMTGYISDTEKAALYSNASCFVLPSHYEGFGMPILEALQYNLPVIASDIPVFHEVAGAAAEFFNKDDPDDIAMKLAYTLDSPATQEEVTAKANRQLQKFTWDANADSVFKALDQLLKKTR